tara:strand:- start:25 stop:174 length:150 start_codon:yes stop_codon:yes gene_type:complete
MPHQTPVITSQNLAQKMDERYQGPRETASSVRDDCSERLDEPGGGDATF